MYYSYTRWKFKEDCVPAGLDHPGPYHTTLISLRPTHGNDFLMTDLEELFYKSFNIEVEMDAYWLEMNPSEKQYWQRKREELGAMSSQ